MKLTDNYLRKLIKQVISEDRAEHGSDEEMAKQQELDYTAKQHRTVSKFKNVNHGLDIVLKYLQMPNPPLSEIADMVGELKDAVRSNSISLN